MPSYKSAPTAAISIPVSPLTPAAFAPFGTVIENPKSAPTSATVNQGTAAKYPEISPFVSYPAPSGKHAAGHLNLFVCNPRTLTDNHKTFTVHILERHPYTTQTFIPMGLDKNDPARRYLVIVAPTLDAGSSKTPKSWRQPPYPQRQKTRTGIRGSPPYPVQKQTASSEDSTISDYSGTVNMKGRGLPDLSNIQAFMCRGDQAVTYGVGTWHAPMVVLGDGPIEFVVVMHENGVSLEDCEECEIEGGKVKVVIKSTDGPIKAKL
ncbi:Ureidoglycolate lyase [Orbilia ellipsospora]|uniref:Ureidoglycolate lyase n=1 Tax=Orbilia ellipsospora TaxID=2528407 RepID=A0AAV9XS14_9PEZI